MDGTIKIKFLKNYLKCSFFFSKTTQFCSKLIMLPCLEKGTQPRKNIHFWVVGPSVHTQCLKMVLYFRILQCTRQYTWQQRKSILNTPNYFWSASKVFRTFKLISIAVMSTCYLILKVFNPSIFSKIYHICFVPVVMYKAVKHACLYLYIHWKHTIIQSFKLDSIN